MAGGGMRFGSLFAGVGGFDIAFESAGWTCAWQVENDPKCGEVLAHHWPEVPKFQDIKEVRGDDLGQVDCIVGGFPCQDISVAGNRAGLDGARSGLWWEYRRVLDELRPEWCVIENVAGLLSSGKPRGSDLGAILRALGDLGYGFAYRVLDAQGFGVPQRRRRVFIVGHLGDARGPAEVLLEPESGGGDLAKGREKGSSVAALTRSGLGGGGPDDNSGQAGHLLPVAGALTTRYGKGVNTTVDDGGLVVADTVRSHPRPGSNTVGNIVVAPVAQRGSSGGGKPRQGYPAVRVNLSVRRLTPLECERLQGFPDNHTFHADTHRYKQMGNAVCVPVVEWIADRMATYMARRVAA